MTVYGDLDVSVIDGCRATGGKIVTAVRDQSKLGESSAFANTIGSGPHSM